MFSYYKNSDIPINILELYTVKQKYWPYLFNIDFPNNKLN